MFKVKKLCVYGVAAISLGASVQAANAQCGTASWYHEGARTANGERYRPDGISAAHRTLPFGTRVEVRNQRTGRSVVVRINDRGPFIRGRIIDLSRGAKSVIGMDGLASVCIAVLGRGPSVASADDHRREVAPRRARTRLAAAYSETKTSARVSGRASLRTKRRIAAAQRRERLAMERRERRLVARERRAEIRVIDRRSVAALRQERQRQNADGPRLSPTDL